MIRKNITVSALEEGRWTLTKILSDPTVVPDVDRAEAKKQLDELNAMDESQYNVDRIVEEVKIRQQKLKEQLQAGVINFSYATHPKKHSLIRAIRIKTSSFNTSHTSNVIS